MKKIKYYILLSLIIIVFITSSLLAYAANGNAIIKSNKFMTDTELSFNEGITWKEYIDKYSPAGLTYSSTYVYYNGNIIYYFNPADLMGNGYGDIVDPDELIYSREYIHANCSHNLTVTQVGTYPCQEKTRVSVCSKCGYRIEEYFAPSIEHNYTIDLDTYVAPSCGVPGYADYNCSYCGSHYTSEVLDTNPDNHFPIAATCTTGMFCRDCGVVLSDPKGHNLDKLGRCQRNGCDYFNPLDNIKGFGTNINNGFNNIKKI